MKSKEKQYQPVFNPTVDLHTHSQASLDANKPISYILKRARAKQNTIVAVSDHNTLNGVNKFLDKKGYDRWCVMELVDDKTLFLPATEITCRISTIPNLKGNPTKVHLLAYGLDRNESSYISKLLQIKHDNDGKVDRGMLLKLQRHFNLDISDNDIMHYIIEKKKTDKGFNTFGKKDVFDFAKKLKLNLTENDEELTQIIHNFQPYERLNLEAEDVINLVHACGGVVVLAHPYSNLKRTARPREVVEYLIAKDIDGFEMYYPFNTFNCDTMMRDICKDHKHLLFTGGSDYHDDDQYQEMQPHHIPYQDPELKQLVKFLDTINELRYQREKGNLQVKSYPTLREFNSIETYKKYQYINNEINESAGKDDFIL